MWYIVTAIVAFTAGVLFGGLMGAARESDMIAEIEERLSRK